MTTSPSKTTSIPRDEGTSVLVPVLLSALWPGLGHLYVGQRFKGAALALGSLGTCCGLGLFWLFALLDVRWVALQLRERDVGPGESAPAVEFLADLFA